MNGNVAEVSSEKCKEWAVDFCWANRSDGNLMDLIRQN